MGKKYLTLGLLAVVVICLVFGAYCSSSTNNINSHSTVKNITHTPEIDQAIFITKLNEGSRAFWGEWIVVDSVFMDPTGKFCILKVHDGNDESWGIVVNIETNASKKNNDTWKSFDEIKALYVVELNYECGMVMGKPRTVTLNGKKLWEIPLYNYPSDGGGFYCNFYFDHVTGKSKNGNNEWKTLKELDDNINDMYGISFRNALRELYPE
jgi:hypothetical protein